MAHQYDDPRPLVTVDCVVFGLDLTARKPKAKGEKSTESEYKDSLKILLIKRGRKWALPGGHIGENESPLAAAYRELLEETWIKVPYLEQLYTFGRPNRDPNGWCISIAHFALVPTWDKIPKGGDDAAAAKWVPLKDAKGLALDHSDIVKTAVERLQAKIQYTPIGFNLLPTRFTLRQIQGLYESILMKELDKRNFRKRILATGILELAGVETESTKPGPKAQYYTFNVRAYNTVRNFTFEV